MREIQRAGSFIKNRHIALRRMQAGYFHLLSLLSVSVTMHSLSRAGQNLNL
ncbi:hypothetical protein BN129_2809 [Cronobacter sakazakii 701]|nr:hypothetical protein BN129_2809 [Cronobacter sakazakii 701]